MGKWINGSDLDWKLYRLTGKVQSANNCGHNCVEKWNEGTAEDPRETKHRHLQETAVTPTAPLQ